jgi:hypothetical protein
VVHTILVQVARIRTWSGHHHSGVDIQWQFLQTIQISTSPSNLPQKSATEVLVVGGQVEGWGLRYWFLDFTVWKSDFFTMHRYFYVKMSIPDYVERVLVTLIWLTNLRKSKFCLFGNSDSNLLQIIVAYFLRSLNNIKQLPDFRNMTAENLNCKCMFLQTAQTITVRDLSTPNKILHIQYLFPPDSAVRQWYLVVN